MKEGFLRDFMPLKHGIPGHGTFSDLSTDVAGVSPGRDAMRGKLRKAGWSDGTLIEPVRAAVGLEPPPQKILKRLPCRKGPSLWTLTVWISLRLARRALRRRCPP